MHNKNSYSNSLQISGQSNLLSKIAKQSKDNLPAICHPRHYLLRGVKRDADGSFNSIIKKKLNKMGDQTQSKATIYNVEFRKKFNGSQYKFNTINYDNYANSHSLDKTSLKPRRQNVRYRFSNYFNHTTSKTSIELNKSQSKLKTITINSQVCDLASQSMKSSLKGFSPRMVKLDLSKKQIQFLTNNLSRFQEYSEEIKEIKLPEASVQEKEEEKQEKQERSELIQRRKLKNANTRYLINQKSEEMNNDYQIVKKKGNVCTPWAHEENASEFLDFLF